VPDALTARDVGLAAEAGDPLALAVWQEVGERLGQALAAFIDLLNPERVVIGGIYPRCEKFIAPAMRAVIAREALPPARPTAPSCPPGSARRSAAAPRWPSPVTPTSSNHHPNTSSP
jgi:glucokinase